MLSGEFAGQWWLPGRRKRLGGMLKLEPGRQPMLHVMGPVSDLQQRLGAMIVEHPTVLGVTALGQSVTLVDAHESGGNTNLLAPDAGDTVITAARAYVGGHYRREDQAAFRSVVLELSGLSNWFPPPLIDRQLETSAGQLKQAILSFEPADDVTIEMPFGSLAFGYTFGASGNLRTEAHFQQHARVVATHRHKQPLAWWLRTVVKPLRFLLSLTTEDPTVVEAIYLRPRPGSSDGQVEVVWANDVPPERPERHAAEMLFWFADLEDRFADAMRDWFAAVDEAEVIFNQYFATLNTARSYGETRFLMTVQAAEAYQRDRLAAPASTAGKRADEVPLLRRLTALCDFVPEVAQLMVGSDATGFARNVRDARNLRTHLNRPGRNPQTRPDLVLLGAQLAVILEAAILRRELGFSSADIADRLARASRLRRLAVAASRQRPELPE